MIKITATFKREEVKRVVRKTLGDVAIEESGIILKVMVDEEEKCDMVKAALKQDPQTSVLYTQVAFVSK